MIIETQEAPVMYYTATYSPEDNKLRLYASSRLDPETYARVKAAGFSWAPRQELFAAPMWTPEREDLLMELAGEIGDEDTSLVDRAEQRAERFEDYSDARRQDAERAREAVSSIADNIPLGQPILVGHHSERHARRDAERIENGMRRAVRMWETSQYWRSRAAGAIRAAKYKELPAVRARRIKGLEADLRSYIASYTPHENQKPIMQSRDGQYGPDAEQVPYVWVGPKGRGGHWVMVESLPAIKARAQRWIQHIENRLVYERAMLAEGGGLAADKFDIEVGGRVSGGGEWYVVTKLNKKDGVLQSVSVIGRWCSTLQVEDIKDYRPPEEGDSEKVKAATKQAPLCNFRSEGCAEMTTDEWKRLQRCTDSAFVHTFKATETTGAYRQRTQHGRNWTRVPVFLTDAKVTNPPAVVKTEPVRFEPVRDATPAEPRQYREPERTEFDALREQLRAGVQVVTAPQLFPTPADLAARMVEAAGIGPDDRVLEPSAGTGAIMRQVGLARIDCTGVAVEINEYLADKLSAQFMTWQVKRADFLTCNGDLGKFDAILMNPPFANAQDIAHIQHALTMLKPGGRLVAICANGPRQREALHPIVEQHGGTWEDLPADTFKESGTGVNAAMISLTVEPFELT